ncbi:ABC transporter ATP-binding protein (plasmid) [Streptomyces cadmiisoli]|uniref:ABC transporter ATP-binding protein n=1 Tax=Streptomyces cadmiisoli TaxID=2184053 RepID=A0A2Z4JDR0_9ACTN|nr:ABC transporter ATP-binding protein [Streptomyces cadmiisoli]
MPDVIVVESVSRHYGRHAEVQALHDVSLRVAEGEVVALLGDNGAGKTTLSKIIATLLLPSSGLVSVAGHDIVRSPRAVRAVVSSVFGGERGLYGRLSGRHNLEFFAALKGIPHSRIEAAVDEVLATTGLRDAADRAVRSYSRGMKQRLHLAVSSLTRPRVLLLDEPTIGLDPSEADRLRGAVASLRESGVAILLTSHQLLDVERLADRVVLLSQGQIRSDTDLETFRRSAGYTAVATVYGSGTPPRAQEAAQQLGSAEVRVEPEGWTLSLRVRRWDTTTFRRLAAILDAAGEGREVHSIDVAPLRLEDVYSSIGGPQKSVNANVHHAR